MAKYCKRLQPPSQANIQRCPMDTITACQLSSSWGGNTWEDLICLTHPPLFNPLSSSLEFLYAPETLRPSSLVWLSFDLVAAFVVFLRSRFSSASRLGLIGFRGATSSAFLSRAVDPFRESCAETWAELDGDIFYHDSVQNHSDIKNSQVRRVSRSIVVGRR